MKNKIYRIAENKKQSLR